MQGNKKAPTGQKKGHQREEKEARRHREAKEAQDRRTPRNERIITYHTRQMLGQPDRSPLLYSSLTREEQLIIDSLRSADPDEKRKILLLCAVIRRNAEERDKQTSTARPGRA